MSRDLHHSLFNPSESDSQRTGEKGENRTSLELAKMRRFLQEVESRLDTQERRTEELVNSSQKAMERFQSSLQMLEKNMKGHIQDINSALSMLKGKVAERKASELKVEEMIERHNQLVQNFESRLGQMQKIVNEQEMRLLGYKSTLQELQRKL